MVLLQILSRIERQIIEISKKIQIGAWKSYPNINRKSGEKIYSKADKAMIKQKRKTRKKWQQTRNPQTKTELIQITKTLSLEIKKNNNAAKSRSLSELSSEHLATTFSLTDTSANSVYKNTIFGVTPVYGIRSSYCFSKLWSVLTRTTL